MCNLYNVGPRPKRNRHHWERDIADALDEIGPSHVAPGKPGIVVRAGWKVSAMSWGFTRPFANRPINNARDDKLAGPLWAPSWKSGRCLVPMRCFFEWSGPRGSKLKHTITPDPDGWFYVAGLWEEGENGAAFTVITTPASQPILPIHNRMPAILPADRLEEYLNAPSPPGPLVRPYPGHLAITPPANQQPELW